METFKKYGASLLLLSAFSLMVLLELMGSYLPIEAPIAARTDFRAYYNGALTYRAGKNPYNLAEYDKVYAQQLAPMIGQEGTKEFRTPYLYPPFSILAFNAFFKQDIYAYVRLLTVATVLAEIGSVMVLILICSYAGIGATATLLGTALLSFFYLNGGPALEAIRLGQLSPIIGFVMLVGLHLVQRGKVGASYVVLALGAGLKITPGFLVGATRVRPLLMALTFLVPLVVINALDFKLLLGYLASDKVPPQPWLELAYVMTTNHSLAATSYRLLGSEGLGIMAGYGLILVTLGVLTWKQCAQLGWVSKGRWKSFWSGEKIFCHAGFVLLGMALGNTIFWEQHLTMYVGVLLGAEAFLAMRAKPEPILHSVAAFIAVVLLVVNPRITFGGGLMPLTILLQNTFTLGAIWLWGRYLWQTLLPDLDIS
jgi:hypothetical protein